MGRGLSNLIEFTRMGEITRSMEQTALWDNNDSAYTAGFIRGVNRSLVRTLTGVYEIATFPIPNHSHGDYGPILKPQYPVYPASYEPNFIADSAFSTDASIGFSGGDIAPHFPGSRFRIFDY